MERFTTLARDEAKAIWCCVSWSHKTLGLTDGVGLRACIFCRRTEWMKWCCTSLSKHC